MWSAHAWDMDSLWTRKLLKAAGLVAVGALLATAGIYAGHVDDAPPLGLLGLLSLVVSVVLAIRTLRPRN